MESQITQQEIKQLSLLDLKKKTYFWYISLKAYT